MSIMKVTIDQNEIKTAVTEYLKKKLNSTLKESVNLKVKLVVHDSWNDQRDGSPGWVEAVAEIPI